MLAEQIQTTEVSDYEFASIFTGRLAQSSSETNHQARHGTPGAPASPEAKAFVKQYDKWHFLV
jgi:hypothetical protein